MVRAEASASARVVRLLAFLNRSLFANKVRNYSRNGRVEADHVQHAAVVRGGEGETVAGHAHNDRLRVADELFAIPAQFRRRVDKGLRSMKKFVMQPIGDHSNDVQRDDPTEARMGKYNPTENIASTSNSHLNQP